MRSNRVRLFKENGIAFFKTLQIHYRGIVLQNEKLGSEILWKLSAEPIQRLVLDDCNLRDKEAERLAEAIPKCSTLQLVIITRNQISEKGVKLLQDVCKEWKIKHIIEPEVKSLLFHPIKELAQFDQQLDAFKRKKMDFLPVIKEENAAARIHNEETKAYDSEADVVDDSWTVLDVADDERQKQDLKLQIKIDMGQDAEEYEFISPRSR